MRERGAARNLNGDRPARGRDSHPSTDTVTSGRAPDSWRPTSLSGPVLCWGRGSGDPRTPSSLPPRSSTSPAGFLSPSSGLLGVPLPGGSWLRLRSPRREGKAAQEQLHIPPSREGTKGVLASSRNFGGPLANFPQQTGGSCAKPSAWWSPTSGSTQSSRVASG